MSSTNTRMLHATAKPQHGPAECAERLNINININLNIDINININFNINTNKTHIHHCFGTIEHFLARMDMKIRPVRSEINFLPDFIGFKSF